MRKITLTMIFATIIITGAWSQVNFGIKAGVNIANQVYTGGGVTSSPGSLIGFHGGVYLHARLGKFGIQPEAFYSMAGSKPTYSGASNAVKTNYISLPILLRWNITDFFNIHAGPQFGLLLSAKQTFNGTTTDIKSQLKSGDFGIAGGAGFDLPMGLNGGARVVGGLSNVDKSSVGGTKTRNFIFQLYLGLRLIGK
jgi:hypothetical protein